MAYDVFISYRRQGGGADARMMYDRLQSYGYTVSFDMDTLKNGNFNEELLKRVAECKNFVVLLSENCFERTLNGCKREDDWLRIEIATALYNNKNIVTVMLPGFEFPAKLPPDIDAIRNKNGPKYDLYYIDGFYDRLTKDFLVREDSSSATAISNLETIFAAPEVVVVDQNNILDVIGDDTDFLRQEALQKYEKVSRLLPFSELENLDEVWGEAEKKKGEGDYKEAAKLYLKVLDLCNNATPCSLAFVMRMAADEIDTRKRDWFGKALARAQGGDVDYEYGVGCIYAGGLGVAKDVASAFRWFERAARHGNAQAMAAVGAAYSIGSGVETDYASALEWLTKAAAEGLPVAEERLGYLYQNGLGVDCNLTLAREWYEKAATLGNSAARAALGTMYLNGVGVEKDEEKAMAWYREAAADEHPEALRILAENLFAAKDAAKCGDALGYCRRAVNAGDVEAICVLGLAYGNGAGVEKDLKKAGELYQKAKSLGSKRADRLLKEMEPETEYWLGIKYMEGRGVAQDFACARSWFERAAGQDHVEATAWLGYLLGSGRGGDVDMKSAIELYEKAAAGGSAVALFNLAELYLRGTWVKEDKPKALRNYEAVASRWQSVPEESRWLAVRAFTRMADMYEEGKSCPKNVLLAARLRRFAAQCGSIPACQSLGTMYRDGRGVAKSEGEMERWFAEMWRLCHESLNPCDGESMHFLGLACQSGQGCPRDLMAASEWWHRGMAQIEKECGVDLINVGKQHSEILREGDIARVLALFEKNAKAGSRVSMANLGQAYRCGWGVKVDAEKAAKWFKLSAEAGFGGAMYVLAFMYDAGEGVDKDEKNALEWLQKAANAGFVLAQVMLAMKYRGGTGLGRDFCKSRELLEKVLEKNPENEYAVRRLGIAYRDGLGVDENIAQANELFVSILGKLNRCAEDQDAASQDNLADYYYRGYGVSIDSQKAASLYEKAAQGKNKHAMNQLQRFYRFGVGCEPDLNSSSKWARTYIETMTSESGEASRGIPDSCLAVGNYYRCGYGVDADPATALSWYEKAAAKKSWGAMLEMARMLLAGDEVAQDRKAAKEWAEKAVAELTPLAENGLAEAQRALADCYVSGLGVKKSIEEAVKLYVEAYEGRDWLAAGRLARFYASGKGVEQDLDKARELLQKAADRNDGEAEGLLGECYENGAWGFPRDVQKAFEWYRQSASEGDACGLFNVGRCYESGIGVEQDHGKAEMWLRLAAAEKGEYWGYDLKAAELLDELKGKSKKGRKNATKTHKPCKVGTAKKRKGRSHA